jgi:hypothetical protein
MYYYRISGVVLTHETSLSLEQLLAEFLQNQCYHKPRCSSYISSYRFRDWLVQSKGFKEITYVDKLDLQPNE